MFGAALYNEKGNAMFLGQEQPYIFAYKFTTPATGFVSDLEPVYSGQLHPLNVRKSLSDPPVVFTRNEGGGDIRQIKASIVWQNNQWYIHSGGATPQTHYVFTHQAQTESDPYGLTIYDEVGGILYHSAYRLLQIEASGVLNQEIRTGDPDYPAIDNYVSVPKLTNPAIALPIGVYRSVFKQQHWVTNFWFYIWYDSARGRITNQFYKKYSLNTLEPSWPDAVFSTHTFAVIDSARYDN